jgi:Pyruvate/2-oxoacid:ferredoxin oxidoreductase delta subunit
MTEDARAMHYVCTHQEAAELIAAHDRFWIMNCGCRESRGAICARSCIDVCLTFDEVTAASGTGKRAVTRDEVAALQARSHDAHLVIRPFRGIDDRTVTEGICHCCDDCCGYFLDSDERRDKGSRSEKTDLTTCDHCASCVTFCHFGARSMVDGRLEIERNACYGCGVCVEACPIDAIVMEVR